MPDKPTAPDFDQSNTLIDELFADVTKWEGSLAGGQKLKVGGSALDSLKETKVQFGNPKDNLIAITEAALHNSGLAVTSIRKQQMDTDYDFYYLTLTVDMRPKPGAVFKSLTCELNFGPKGPDEPIVQAIFPSSKWHDVMQFGGGMSLALDGNLDWQVGVDASQIANVTGLPADVKAGVVNKNEMNSFIVMPDFSYSLGRFDIAASGEGNSECYWHIEDPDLQKSVSFKFGVVFKVPKETESITLIGLAWAEPNMSWLTANIKNVFRDLSEKLQNILRKRDDASKELAKGAAEEWVLKLPKAAA
ncbi:MAG: hypothetical protein R6X34_22015 [Chloroflexota bacterium]|jgi:hypothetical protein